ncbi:MAG: HDIG domain-containing protein [Myxococcota bacterium]
MIPREKAVELLNEKITNENTRKHCLASEAVMRGLARKLGADEEMWGLCGLLHDIDLEYVQEDLSRHASVGAGWLKELGFPDEAVHAVLAHNDEGTGIVRESPLDFALACAEQVTGLIVATALVYPSKKLADVKVKSVMKRMKERRFAAGVKRERIMECEKLKLSLDEFTELTINAMQEISAQLGL